MGWVAPRLSILLSLIEKMRFYLSGLMQNSTDQNKGDFFSLKDQMRLKTEPTKAGSYFVLGLPDPRKVGEKVECSLKTGMVRVSLMNTEGVIGVIINVNEIAYRPFR